MTDRFVPLHLSVVGLSVVRFSVLTAEPGLSAYIVRGKSWRVLIELSLLVGLSLFYRLPKLRPALQLPRPPFLGMWVGDSGDGLTSSLQTVVFFPRNVPFFMCSVTKSESKIPNSGLEFKKNSKNGGGAYSPLLCVSFSQFRNLNRNDRDLGAIHSV